MASLRARLLIVMTALTVGTVLFAGTAVYLTASSALREDLDESLVELARTELASATDTGYVHVHEPSPGTIVVRGVPGYEKFAWITDSTGRVLARTDNVGDGSGVVGASPYEKQARKGSPLFGNIVIGGHALRAIFYPFQYSDGRMLVGIVGVPSVVTEKVISGIGQVVVVVGLCCVLISTLVTWFLAKGLSDPLKKLAITAEAIDPDHPDPDAFVEAPYSEIHGVAAAINGLVGRVGQMLGERNRTIEAQRQFLADASHELRTPVSNLQGTIEVSLRRERSAEEYRQTLSSALQESRRMGRLVGDLLDLAKSDLGQFAVRLEPMNLAEVVREGLVSADPTRLDSLELRLDVPDELLLTGDRDRLRQAFDNLLQNALTHAATYIAISASAAGERVLLRVENDGIGLSEEETGRVFERFFRTDSSRARHTGGSGLGLAIVRAIVERHGGSISVMSGGGKTVFAMELPR